MPNIGTTWTFDYTGTEQTFNVRRTGTYKVELWGAQGGNAFTNSTHSLGAYTSGNIKLFKSNTFYIYIGEAGRDNGIATYNGGGKGGYVVPYFEIPNSVIETTYDKYFGNSGGGASDIRLINGNWNDKSSLISRIMVAGGGGGDGTYDYSNQNSSSGGLIGYKGNYYQGHGDTKAYGTGGTQFLGGSAGINIYTSIGTTNSGTFGIGGSSYNYSSGAVAGNSGTYFGNPSGHGSGGGGGGWYGGGAGGGTGAGGNGHGGGGGSSYISGHAGCIGITSNGTPKTNLYSNINDSYSYNGYYFTNTKTIDGQGYNWTTEKEKYVGMPTHDGASIMTGNSGNGYAKITLISY